jgi:hypothetical protein
MKSRKTKPYSMKSTWKDDSSGPDSLSIHRPPPSSNVDSSLRAKLMRLLRLDAESCQMRKARREYVARISFSSHSQVSTVPLKLAAKVFDNSEEEILEAKHSSATVIGCPRRSSQTFSEGENESTLDERERPDKVLDTSISNDTISCQEATLQCKLNSTTISPSNCIKNKIPRSNSTISFNSSVEVINIPRAKDYSRSTRHKLW